MTRTFLKTIAVCAGCLVLSAAAHAQDSSFVTAGKAAGLSVKASAHGAGEASQVALGAVALPLMATGAVASGVGDLSRAVSEGAWDAATPLSVSDEVLAAPELDAPITPGVDPAPNVMLASVEQDQP
ncbi:MAG: hypothetical protein ACFB2Z_12160 [Maricaulaceae bacterium]